VVGAGMSCLCHCEERPFDGLRAEIALNDNRGKNVIYSGEGTMTCAGKDYSFTQTMLLLQHST
jgi:hypothetical protein